MSDYTELVKALRHYHKAQECNECAAGYEDEWCDKSACIFLDAAAAIEELQAQLPKRGEWIRVENEESYHYECSKCGERPLYSRYGDVVLSGGCPMCGAKMEVQDADT